MTLAAILTLAASLAPAAHTGGDEPSPATRTRQKLKRLITTPEFEKNTPLKEALRYLSDKGGVTILLDIEAYKSDLQIMEPENYPIALPPIQDKRLEGVLGLILEQTEGDFFVDNEGLVRVVPHNTYVDRILQRRVSANFSDRPLKEALRELSDETGVTVVLDERRAGDRVKTPVTVNFRHVTVEAAVMILTDMAELQVVMIDRAVLVTTPENVRRIKHEQEIKDHKDRESMLREMEQMGLGKLGRGMGLNVR
jgi:hypothetical protein